MKKVIAIVVVVAMMLAFSASAFAYTRPTVSSASGDGEFIFENKIPDYSGFSVSGTGGTGNASFTATPGTYGTSTKLTGRAYHYFSESGRERASNAKTYSADVRSGGQTYWSTYTDIDFKVNTDCDGSRVTMTGLWKF